MFLWLLLRIGWRLSCRDGFLCKYLTIKDAYLLIYFSQIHEGDGAFYGPKIDIGVFDALKRKFQCATLQVMHHRMSTMNLSELSSKL